MRLGTVQLRGEVRTIAARSGRSPIRDITDLTDGDPRRVFGRGADEIDLDHRPEIDLTGATWLPPVLQPAKVFCVGFNYRTHASEESRQLGDQPTLFTRFPSTFVGHGASVLSPVESSTLDWEGEVVVVVGRGGRRIPMGDAMDHVAGWSVMGENSVREYQLHSSQATAGKNWDRSGSWGPWIITRDEVPDPSALEVVTRLNGVEKQRGHLGQLMFDLPTLLAYISTFTELSPGDVIATGTPAGIGHREDPPRYLRDGDELTIELTGYCTLRNRVQTDPGHPGGDRMRHTPIPERSARETDVVSS